MIAQKETTPRNARPGPTYDGRPVDAVIDVRSKLEFWLGHLDGAVCIPLDVVAAQLPRRADKGAAWERVTVALEGSESLTGAEVAALVAGEAR